MARYLLYNIAKMDLFIGKGGDLSNIRCLSFAIMYHANKS